MILREKVFRFYISTLLTSSTHLAYDNDHRRGNMNKNLLERLRKLTLSLAEAKHDNDEKLIEKLEDDIFDLEFQIQEESEYDYADNHNKDWH